MIKLCLELKCSGTLKDDIIRISSREEFEVVNDCVQIQALPAALRIKGLLNEMTEIQEQSLDNDVDEFSSRSHFLIVLLVALLFTAALISEVLGASITRSISESILSVSKLADDLVHGNSRDKQFPIQSKKELGT